MNYHILNKVNLVLDCRENIILILQLSANEHLKEISDKMVGELMSRMLQEKLQAADKANESGAPPKLTDASREATVRGSVEVSTSASQKAPPYGQCPPKPVCNVPGWKVVRIRGKPKYLQNADGAFEYVWYYYSNLSTGVSSYFPPEPTATGMEEDEDKDKTDDAYVDLTQEKNVSLKWYCNSRTELQLMYLLFIC